MNSKNEGVDSNIAPAPSGGCNLTCLNGLYFRLYPSVHKRAINELGKALQQWLLFLVFAHLFLFFTSFAFVGVYPTLINLACFALVFSSYRSMQDCSMWMYAVMLTTATVVGVIHIFGE